MEKMKLRILLLLILCGIVFVLPVAAANPPVAEAGADSIWVVNGIYRFNGGFSSDSDGTIVSYAWDFGDSTSGTGEITEHTYTAEGIYTVTLTVTDNDGLTGSDTRKMTIVKRGREVTKSASKSQIGVGDQVTYTYRVVNNGVSSIFNPVLTDDKLGVIAGPISGDIDNDGIIDHLELTGAGHLGEIWIYTVTTTLDVTTSNTATLTGLDMVGIPITLTSNSVTVTVKAPAQMIQDLKSKVKGLGLKSGIENAFNAKLTAAEKKISQAQNTPARQELLAFINQVNAQRGKALTTAQANELVAIAQRIINAIPGK